MMRPTPDLCDDHSDKIQVLRPSYNNYGGTTSFYGQIATVYCPEDNTFVKKEVQKKGLGRVLIVDGGSSDKCAYVGDKIASIAYENGWSGLVINGMVRDVEELRDINIGIKAVGVHPMKSEKRGLGEIGVNLKFGGVTFLPGYFVYCDANGVIVSKTKLT